MFDFSLDAIALYEQRVAAEPDCLALYWDLGLAWLLRGEEDEAQSVWLAAVAQSATLEADISQLLIVLAAEADRQLKAGQFYTAERIYLHQLQWDPSQAETFVQLGSAVSQQGRYDQAIAYWQSAIALQPNLPTAYCRQAEVWQQLGQFDQAIAAYTQAIDIESNPDWQIYYNLGLCLSQQQSWQPAIGSFQRAIALNPNAAAYGDLGWALLQQGEQHAAIAQFHQAVYLKSRFAQTYAVWVAALNAQNNFDSAEGKTIAENALFLMLLPQQNSSGLEHSLKTLLQRMNWNSAPSPASRSGSFYETASWAAESPNSCYWPLDPPHDMALISPQTIDREIHFSFRFGQTVALPGTFVAHIPEGRFWLSADQTSSAVLTAENQLLGDLSPEFPLLSPGHPDQHPGQHSLFSQDWLPPAQKIEGTVIVLAGLMNDMYFHWMLDVLPRWQLLCSYRGGDASWDAIEGVVVSDRLPFQQETLHRLGIPPDKIFSTAAHSHIQATQLIVPSYPASPAWMPGWACEWLKQKFLPKHLPKQEQGIPKRLYISRSYTANRRLINELELLKALQPWGFQTVYLESLAVSEQAALFAQAEVVIAPHGGGLTNLVFCRAGTKVIELFSPQYVYPCYWLISNWVELEYGYLLGVMPEGRMLHQLFYSNARTADFLIDLDELKRLLEQMDIFPLTTAQTPGQIEGD